RRRPRHLRDAAAGASLRRRSTPARGAYEPEHRSDRGFDGHLSPNGTRAATFGRATSGGVPKTPGRAAKGPALRHPPKACPRRRRGSDRQRVVRPRELVRGTPESAADAVAVSGVAAGTTRPPSA